MIHKAMIFAAGLGTRFKPWTDHHPKALALVNGKTLLERNLLYLQQYGIYDVVVNVHHFADQVISYLKEHNNFGSRVIISDETDMLLETGGGMWKAKQWLSDAPFLTVNADFLTNLNLHHFVQFHEQHQSLASIAVTQRKASRSFLFDDNDRLCGWQNNNTGERRISLEVDHYIPKSFSCVAAYQPEIFEKMVHTGKFSIVDTLLDVAKNNPLYGFDHTGDVTIDVGKPESVAEAEKFFP